MIDWGKQTMNADTTAEGLQETYTKDKAIIFNIQRYSLHDGHGIRTLVFMKGCPLSCKWCSNPEGQYIQPQLEYLDVNCAAPETCRGRCAEVCPTHAIKISDEGRPITDWSKCIHCGWCANACFFGARKVIGKKMTIDQVMQEVEKDRDFYSISGGGVSVGGGELLMQADFVSELLRRCQAKSIHTAIETCGYARWECLQSVLDYTDQVFYDIKHMDSRTHKELTGVKNDLILENARKMFACLPEKEITIRLTIIPGMTDSAQNVEDTAKFVKECGGKKMELLPYHKFGTAKYRQCGMLYELPDLEPPTDETMEYLREIVRGEGLEEMTGAV